MKSIEYDKSSGELLQGVVWEVRWISLKETMDAKNVFAKYHDARLHDVPLCRRGPDHVEDVRVDWVAVNLFGDRPGNFVQMTDHGFLMVTEVFAKELKASGLTGFELRDIVKIAENHTPIEAPMLLLLEFAGRGGFCHRFKVKGGANLCPRCQRSSVICPFCGTIFDTCPACNARLVAYDRKQENAELFIFEGFPKERLIVADRDWDGSDIFSVGGPAGGVFVSRRAKGWLERSHVFEIHFRDALIDVS